MYKTQKQKLWTAIVIFIVSVLYSIFFEGEPLATALPRGLYAGGLVLLLLFTFSRVFTQKE